MESGTPIDYVEIASEDSPEGVPAFFFQRIVEASLPAAWNDPPHRHNFQEIIIVESGSWHHSVDGRRFVMSTSTVALIGKGQVHVVEAGSDVSMWLIRFNDDFLPAGLISSTWNYHATLFNQLGAGQALSLQPSDMHDLRRVLDLIESEYAQPATFQQASVLRHLLSVLIIRLERVHQNTLSATPYEREEHRVYEQFMALLESEFARHHDVQYYAAALQMPPVKLSRILGRIVGKATKQLIDDRIVLEAKRYLRYTDLSIKEIAFALGYGDLFHFSKTFKRVTKTAPQLFREQSQK